MFPQKPSMSTKTIIVRQEIIYNESHEKITYKCEIPNFKKRTIKRIKNNVVLQLNPKYQVSFSKLQKMRPPVRDLSNNGSLDMCANHSSSLTPTVPSGETPELMAVPNNFV